GDHHLQKDIHLSPIDLKSGIQNAPCQYHFQKMNSSHNIIPPSANSPDYFDQTVCHPGIYQYKVMHLLLK
ncbi:MAG: hypothetical protein QNJ58_20165, partial [Desulfobacterales bacterium]|nr:hypothetical protein [Desulfobacterales bacterium]